MRIHHTRFKSLSALGIHKIWRASARFKTELIFHADIAQRDHEIIHRRGNGDGEFAKQPAEDAAEKQHRDEHRGERHGSC